MLTRTQTTRTNIATFIFALGRCIHAAGLNYFSTEQFIKYLSRTDQPEGFDKDIMEAMICLSIIYSIGTNMFVSIPAFHRQLVGRNNVSSPQPEIPVSTREKLISVPLKTGAWSYGVMTMILGFFLTHQISKLCASLTNTHDDDAIWKTLLVDTAGMMVAAIVFLKYATYDIKLSNNNADRIASGIFKREIPVNKAMVVTMLISLFTLTIFPMQVFFFAKPALENTPGIGKSSIAVDLLTAISCMGTMIAILTWMPTIYDVFNQNQPSSNKIDEPVPENKFLHYMKIVAYFIGLNEASIQGMAAFMGIIAISKGLLDLDPYNPAVILLASLAMLNGTAIHAAFGIIPGVQDTFRDVNAWLTQRRPTQPDAERGHARLFQPAPATDEADTPLLIPTAGPQ